MSTVTVVLVHGNPEVDAIWGPLVAALDREDVVRLSPPGFGTPLPDHFPATVLDYRDWLARELARFDKPVDLVGHDFGGVHVMNVVMQHPEVVRSWVTDVIGLFDPEYVWHDAARVWQTPGDGEQFVDSLMGGELPARAAVMASLGIPQDVAAAMAAAQGVDMGRAVLSLYRSAAQPVMAEAGRGLESAATRPGLSLLPTEDHLVGTEEMRRRSADRAGARTEVLDGLGHWWMLQDPARGAAVLRQFWESLA